MLNKYLILGDGLLGSEIHKQTGWDYISRKKNSFDFLNLKSYCELLEKYKVIINCIAFTKTYSPDKQKHMETNFRAVCDLVDYCRENNKKIVHISTDYIYGKNSVHPASEEDVPVHAENWYSYSKLLADGYVQVKAKKYLLIRTSFKPCPFPYAEALMIYGNFDYTHVIAKTIIQMIERKAEGIYNIGTESKSMYQLALETKPDVNPSFAFKEQTMPKDVRMSTKKMENFLKDNA